jgi:hypothetical protein
MIHFVILDTDRDKAKKKPEAIKLPACESTTLNMLFAFSHQHATKGKQGEGHRFRGGGNSEP